MERECAYTMHAAYFSSARHDHNKNNGSAITLTSCTPANDEFTDMAAIVLATLVAGGEAGPCVAPVAVSTL